MFRSRLGAFVLIGVVALISILVVQFFWLRNTVRIQQTHAEIQNKEDSLVLAQFAERGEIALQNVLESIRIESGDSSDQYGAVKIHAPNYFSVDLNGELQPAYLEVLLIREFYKEHIRQDFKYGIYDCFIDSIVSGNYVSYTKDSLYVAKPSESTFYLPKLPNKDGHYFIVKFPKVNDKISFRRVNDFSPWWYIGIIILVVSSFFIYSILIILQQKRLSELKNDFINNMTHELKTPISTIGLSSEMLLNTDLQKDPDKVIRYAGIIYKENKRLENQVERVLHVAKLDKEELGLSKERMDILEILKEAKSSFENNQLVNGGKITIRSEKDRIELMADPVHLINVVYNLIDNAIKYCVQLPEIDILVQEMDDLLRIQFTDNGIGMRNEDSKMIFEKFYRIPTGNRHDVKGFGLGLYYVKLIMDAHKGKIEVKSKVDEGSTFTISLPLS